MQIPKLKIGQLEFDLPIVQGAMGVQVSSYPLPAVVSNCGALGTMTSMGLGDPRAVSRNYVHISSAALAAEIKLCQSLTDKPMALNVMGALSNTRDLIRVAVDNGVKILVYGAGIPRDLPELVADPSVNLVPIISSAKLAGLILKLWQRHYQVAPSAFILEGPLAGGHLGFNQAQLDNPKEFCLENILSAVLEVVRPYEQVLGRKIPIITAGGIYTGEDIARMLSLGAAGVQMGTRFVVTHECPAAPEYKQAYLDTKKEDIVIIHSPVGMLGRAKRNAFLAKVEARQVKMECPYHCISSCDIKRAGFCIARALCNAKAGQLDDGLIFVGANAYRLDRLLSVQELLDELILGLKASILTLPNI